MKLSFTGKKLSPVAILSLFHLCFAAVIFSLSLLHWIDSRSLHCLLLSGFSAQFACAQFFAFTWAQKDDNQATSSWLVIWSFSLSALLLPLLVSKILISSMLLLAAIPLFIAGSNQYNRLPMVLFIIFLVSAATILVDLFCPWADWRLAINGNSLILLSAVCFILYCISLALVDYFFLRRKHIASRARINVATQYALVITIISATSIILMTGVMINQIRNAQINQVGKGFQTLAENFGQLTGVHLEQQIQKLQLLTQQLPIFKETLTTFNSQYEEDSAAAKALLLEKNIRWEKASSGDAFVLEYLNNDIIKSISRFRGHNSFHHDMVLVDKYGGLVASLGQKPEKIYYFDQEWWQYSWNQGLGNTFVGDLTFDESTKIPMLRIAVDIIDHSTNEFIGLLSSTYLLKTLLQEMQSFKPDFVSQISLTDHSGKVIASTATDIGDGYSWQHIDKNPSPENPEINRQRTGWVIGKDYNDNAALIGYSRVTSTFNLISNPLYRLNWRVIVSGTRSNALVGVTRSTKMMLMVGLAAMALGVLAAIAAARVITRPIEHLTATAASMSKGDLDNRAKLTGPQELVALSAVFNRLTDQLHKNITSLKTQTKQLEKAKSEAETATKLKGEFLAKMSHEIRTPLNAILGFADLLHDSLEDSKDRRHAETIKTSGTDLLDLINDILDMSKIEAGRMELNLKPVDLRKLFSDLKRIFSISAREKEIKIEIDVSNNMPVSLMLDKVRIRQVLFNLIGNAIKFTEKGRIQCTADAVPASDNHDYWNLSMEVTDTGIGIDPDEHSEIFEIFKQHGKTQNEYIDGTGLGLTISKSLIEMMGGQIEVSGEKDKGSCFTIFLPEVGTPASEVELKTTGFDQELTPDEILFAPASILLVDDLDVNRQLIQQSLKNTPFTVLEAADGYEALNQLHQQTFHLIMLDIRMPGIDGYQTLEKINELLGENSPPVIATTAAGMKDEIRRIEESGFDGHLLRPFDRFALFTLLASYLPYERIDRPLTDRHSSSSGVNFNPEDHLQWYCPPDANPLVSIKMREKSYEVLEKQSIPETTDFAEEIISIGENYKIDVLLYYGRELKEHAEAFDITSVEKMLNMYKDILAYKSGTAE